MNHQNKISKYAGGVLLSLNEIPEQSRLALFGAGETGQEFVRMLRVKRPDISVICFFDSYRDGTWDGIPIRAPAQILELLEDVVLIVTSVFWNEIATIVDSKFHRNYKILSNNLINQASHLSSYGEFYFPENLHSQLEGRLSVVSSKFRSSHDQEILRNLFDLRVYKRELEFFSFLDDLIRSQKKNYDTKDKYSRHLTLSSVGYVIEGGVFDGQDTYRFIEILKKSSNFKKIFAFDPFLESLYKGEYFQKMDPKLCDFHDNVLWDCEEKVGFRVDRANPANSTVLRESDFLQNGYEGNSHSAVTIDSFLEKLGHSVDLIKLDVEGSEMNVLKGAGKSILKFKPRMAISIYHCKEHLLDIPEFLLSLHKDYTFSISANNPTFVDMVLYAE